MTAKTDYRLGVKTADGVLKVRCGCVTFRTVENTEDEHGSIQYDIEGRAYYVRIGSRIIIPQLFATNLSIAAQTIQVSLPRNEPAPLIFYHAYNAIRRRVSQFNDDPYFLIPPKINLEEISDASFTKGT